MDAPHQHTPLKAMGVLAGDSFCRVADARQFHGNSVKLLRDGDENYPAWLSAIAKAKYSIDLENYLIREDEVGRAFSDALAGAGVRCRVIFDWLGCNGKSSRRLWRDLRGKGVAVRCYNPLHLAPTTIDLPRGLIVRRVCQIIGLVGFTLGNVHLSHGPSLNRRQLNRVFDLLPYRAAVLGDCNLIGPVNQSRFKDVGPRQRTHMAGTVLPLRLDRCFIRGLDCSLSKVLAKGGSDHHPILVELQISPGDPSARSCA